MKKRPFNPSLLPISTDINWNDLVPELRKANIAMSKYQSLGEIFPSFAGFPAYYIRAIFRKKEAQTSSAIEGTRTSLENIMEAQFNDKKDPINVDNDTLEVINCYKAIEYAEEQLEILPLTARLIKNTHRILFQGIKRSKNIGLFRTEEVYIGQPGATKKEAIFIPPEHLKINAFFLNLESYIHNFKEKDPLVQAAIIHAQFEMIHPFTDGNGRTGRILITLFFLLKEPKSISIYLSTYLEAHREEYCAHLQAISKEGNWIGWIKFFLKTIDHQLTNDTKKIKEILTLHKETTQFMVREISSNHTVKIISWIFEHPIFFGTHFIKESKIPKSSGFHLLQSMIKTGILRQDKNRRPSLYSFTKLMDILRKE